MPRGACRISRPTGVGPEGHPRATTTSASPPGTGDVDHSSGDSAAASRHADAGDGPLRTPLNDDLVLSSRRVRTAPRKPRTGSSASLETKHHPRSALGPPTADGLVRLNQDDCPPLVVRRGWGRPGQATRSNVQRSWRCETQRPSCRQPAAPPNGGLPTRQMVAKDRPHLRPSGEPGRQVGASPVYRGTSRRSVVDRVS